MSDMFNKLAKMKPKKALDKKVVFEKMPDMMTIQDDSALEDFDLVKFATESIDKAKRMYLANGFEPPMIKVVGVSLHVAVFDEKASTEEQLTRKEFVAMHKEVANIKFDEQMSMDGMEQPCGDGCDGSCKEKKAPMDSEEQPYKAGKYDGISYR